MDEGHVYWISKTGVMSAAKNDGTTSTVVSYSSSGGGIVVDATYVYWSDRNLGVINKVPRSGGSPIELASNMEQRSELLAVDGKYVYAPFFDQRGGIQKVPLAGGTPEIVASEQGSVVGVALDSQFVYWASEIDTGRGAIMKAPIAGGSAVLVTNMMAELRGLALVNDELFWIAGDSIMTVGIAGGQPRVLAPSHGGIVLAADSSHIYVAGLNLIKVSASNGISETLLRLDSGYVSALAVDDTFVYWLVGEGLYKFRK